MICYHSDKGGKCMTVAEPRTRKFTRDEYYRMAELGLFDGQRVELIEGEVIEMSPQGTRHFTSVRLASEALRKAFDEGYEIRPQGPLVLNDHTEPEPDVVVVRGEARDYSNSHPTNALLIVEVADTTLDYDRHRKGSLYARAGIEDYWIVNLNEGCVEVYRNPQAMEGMPFGYGYGEVRVYHRGEIISPIAKPDAMVRVDDLLP